MHEVFLSALINNEDLQMALRILQGHCGIKPVNLLRRRLLWEGPHTRTPKRLDSAFLNSQHGVKKDLWSSLGEQLGRQSYVVSTVYEATRDQFGFPEQDKGQNCDELFGSLRWNDIPDPVAKVYNSRLIVNIDNEKNLCATLISINYKFTREIIQESYRFVHEDVAFEISRYMQLPPDDKNTPPSIKSHLPPYEALIPFDSAGKWILTASVMILHGNDPEQMKRGTAKLMLCKTEFEGVFDLEGLDRFAFDTRVKFQV